MKPFRLLKRNSPHQSLTQSWSLNEPLACVPSENSPKAAHLTFYYSPTPLVWTWCTYRLSQSETQQAQEHKHLQHGYCCRTRTKTQWDTRRLQKKIKEESYSYTKWSEALQTAFKRVEKMLLLLLSWTLIFICTVRGWMFTSPVGSFVVKYQASFHPESPRWASLGQRKPHLEL